MEAADAIAGYVTRGREAFEADAAVRDAVLYQIVVLGEAAKAALIADPSLKVSLPDVEWSPIARMRDRVAHHYWATDRQVVWATATVAVPELRRALISALERLARSSTTPP
ncbi:MAG: HepT-like ribonuclease domain-containing protein [Acidimicrobiales bacterium]